jgi:hypothetical protein
MYHKQKHNATCRKHKRAKRVMTPRNRLRKRKYKRAVFFSSKPSKIHLSYSRKKHRKLRTKTIKRFRKRTPLLQGGDKLNGFSEEDLLQGVIAFANNNEDVQNISKDDSTNRIPKKYKDMSKTKFENVESLPLLMSVYSAIIKPDNIIGKTKVSGDTSTPENTITNEGIQLTISIGDTKSDNKKNIQNEKEIPNKILLKFVINKIREIERNHPHPDLLNTFLYFFDILDSPSALAMVNLYLTKLYELTKGKDMTYDKITTYLEKNLAHHASFADWKGALETAKDDPEKMRKMYLKYTSVVNGIDPYERAQSELNSLFSSAWKPFDPLVSQLDINTDADKTGKKIDITGVGRPNTDKSGVIAASTGSNVTVDSHGVWWTNDTDKSNYEVIPNAGNGDCYFLSIAEALDEYNKQKPDYFTGINKKTAEIINDYNNSNTTSGTTSGIKDNTQSANIDKHINDMVTRLNAPGDPKRNLSFDTEIKDGKITVTNMRSLLALLYFSQDRTKHDSYYTQIINGVRLYKTLEKATRTDDSYSFHYFSEDDDKNIAHILSNNYFADEMVINILQNHFKYKTIVLANHLLTSENTFVARTPDITPLFYVMVNYTNGNHYELIKYSADGKPSNMSSAFEYTKIPTRIKDQYILTEISNEGNHDTNVVK